MRYWFLLFFLIPSAFAGGMAPLAKALSQLNPLDQTRAYQLIEQHHQALINKLENFERDVKIIQYSGDTLSVFHYFQYLEESMEFMDILKYYQAQAKELQEMRLAICRNFECPLKMDQVETEVTAFQGLIKQHLMAKLDQKLDEPELKGLKTRAQNKEFIIEIIGRGYHLGLQELKVLGANSFPLLPHYEKSELSDELLEFILARANKEQTLDQLILELSTDFLPRFFGNIGIELGPDKCHKTMI